VSEGGLHTEQEESLASPRESRKLDYIELRILKPRNNGTLAVIEGLLQYSCCRGLFKVKVYPIGFLVIFKQCTSKELYNDGKFLTCCFCTK